MEMESEKLNAGVVTRKPRSYIRRGFSLAGAAAVAYCTWCGVLYMMQERVMFPGAYFASYPAGEPPEPEIVQTWLTVEDGARVVGWYKPGAGRGAESPGPAVIYFHGNAEFIDSRRDVSRQYTPRRISFLIVEYRGYGRCGGEPSQAAFLEDAARFYDWLAARPEVDGKRILFHGISLGGGVASALTELRPAAGLVLESTFTSAAALAGKYLAPAYLCKHPFRSDRAIATFKAPVLIFHGRNDNIIPVKHGRRLHELAMNSTYVETDQGHNYSGRDWSALHAFLEEHGFAGGN